MGDLQSAARVWLCHGVQSTPAPMLNVVLSRSIGLAALAAPVLAQPFVDELWAQTEQVVESRHAFSRAAAARVEPCACRHVELEIAVSENPPMHALTIDPQDRPPVDQQRCDDPASMVLIG